MAEEKKRHRVFLSFEMVGSENPNVSGEKSPIICLHGLTSAKESWSRIMSPLAEATGRKVYAYDARNHGDSEWIEEFNSEVMQEDLLQFMQGIHAKKAVLLGHSMGGRTAMFFAANRPECVEKLIVEDISLKPSQPHVAIEVQKYIQLLKEALDNIPSEMEDLSEAKKFVYHFLQKNVHEDHRSSRPDENMASSLPLQRQNGKFKWKTNLQTIESLFQTYRTPTKAKGSFDGPTLILYGTKSPFKVSADRDFIRQVFPQAQFRAIEGATHEIHEEFEDLFVKEVADFINDA